ncbi:MAG TPA: hypothetical protein VFW05_00945 [Verrucomicrobiae bacterium]|nr:hypothetical protein [Verrucomicrobiae bacterium]
MKKYIGWMTGCTAAALLTMAGCSTNEHNGNMESTLAAKPTMRAAFMPSQDAFGAFVSQNGTVSCCGSYKGFAYITNSITETLWFTPPAGTTNCIATDSSGFASPYVSVVKAARRADGASWCGTNEVSFAASSSQQYKFMIYIKNTPPPPTNGATLTLDIQWQ